MLALVRLHLRRNASLYCATAPCPLRAYDYLRCGAGGCLGELLWFGNYLAGRAEAS